MSLNQLEPIKALSSLGCNWAVAFVNLWHEGGETQSAAVKTQTLSLFFLLFAFRVFVSFSSHKCEISNPTVRNNIQDFCHALMCLCIDVTTKCIIVPVGHKCGGGWHKYVRLAFLSIKSEEVCYLYFYVSSFWLQPPPIRCCRSRRHAVGRDVYQKVQWCSSSRKHFAAAFIS